MHTFGSDLEKNGGLGKGFDFLRIFLALSVLCTHSFLIAEGEREQFSFAPASLMHASILPMFFALSGFLITGSAMRLSLKDFLLNRAIRIVPALGVDIFVAALVIGPIFTTLTLSEYFSQYEFRAYFVNIFGLIHYVLPGVFEHNPFPNTVNGSLWTVPFEIVCYVIMSGFIGLNLLKRKWVGLAVSILISLIICLSYIKNIDAGNFSGFGWLHKPSINTALHHYFSPRGNMLYIYFLIGSMYYVFRGLIPKNKFFFLGSVVIFALGAFNVFHFLSESSLTAVLAPLIVYMTVYVGLSPIPKVPFFSRGDYSYGIYLYGYPLQQAIVVIFPSIVSPWVHMLISIPITSAVAMLSWHWIEKPALKVRKKFSFTAGKGDVGELKKPQTVDQIFATT